MSETEKLKTDEAPAESDLMKLLTQKYAVIKPCVVDGDEEDNFTVWLRVGVQEFCITQFAGDKEESDFMARMLGKALETFLQVECHRVIHICRWNATR